MRFKIQIEFDKILNIDVFKSSVSVGRSPENDVVISSSSVSRNHCLVETENDRYYITDLESYNGTAIDGITLKPMVKTEFKKSSMITVGKILIQVSKIPKDEKDSADIHKDSMKKNKSSTNLTAGRLELNQPSITLKLEKERKITGPKNPASEHFKSAYTKSNNAIFSYLFLFLVIICAGLIYYFIFM